MQAFSPKFLNAFQNLLKQFDGPQPLPQDGFYVYAALQEHHFPPVVEASCCWATWARHPLQDFAESGVGPIVETGSGHFMALRGPVTLRHTRFRLTDWTATSSGFAGRLCLSVIS